MHSSTSAVLATLLALSPLAHALNILMSNDDGFGSANIREFYRLLKVAGHDVWMVAPATDQSGQGGRFSLTTSPTLLAPTEFNLVPAGAPSIGQDPHDSHIWYYNGTPAVCTTVGLDYVLPNFAKFSTPDLFVSGPNCKTNLFRSLSFYHFLVMSLDHKCPPKAVIPTILSCYQVASRSLPFLLP
jgi:5'-nucleotidase